MPPGEHHIDKIKVHTCRKKIKSLAGYGSSQSVSNVEEVIYVSLWVVLQQLDIGGEISNQKTLPDKDEHSTAYPQQGVLYKNM
jgi:hypothetical protein